MKLSLITALFVLLFMQVFSQKPIIQTGNYTATGPAKALTDTLWPGNSPSATNYVLIEDSLGGYVLGTNSYHSIAIGQRFAVTSSYTIESALYWFGDKKVVAGDSITFAVWRMDSLNAYTMAGENQPGPGTVITSFKTSMNQVDTSANIDGAYFVTFDHPVIVIDDYVIGFDMNEFTADSIGLISTSNGDGLGNELVWEQWGINGTWHTLQASGWGFPALLDVDAMILPVIDLTYAGFTEAPVVNGLSCTLWPNPARENVQLNITAAKSSDQCLVEITDMTGKSILTQAFAGLREGANHLGFNLNNTAAGTYFCIVTSGTSKYAMKFLIGK